jgi:hypothetical protein
VGGQVRRRNQPLAGATVRLIPDEILTNLKAAEGITDPRGYIDFRIPGSDSPGVQPGIYRVEVSLKDASGKEHIPAKYNSQTELGLEVGAAGGQRGSVASASFSLDLKE